MRNWIISKCKVCNKPIKYYVNNPRKYCSRACFIFDRIGWGFNKIMKDVKKEIINKELGEDKNGNS